MRSCRIPVTQVQVWDRELAARAALTRVPRMLGVQAGRAGRNAPADPFTAEHFRSQPVPRWRRLLLRLRGWDA